MKSYTKKCECLHCVPVSIDEVVVKKCIDCGKEYEAKFIDHSKR